MAVSGLGNVQIGVQKLTFGEEPLGHTDGGCEFSYSPEYTDVMVDAFGSTVVDKVLTGEAVTVKVPLAEVTLEKLKNAIPTATLVTDASTPAKKVLTIGSTAGKRLSASAQTLTLHPTFLLESDKSYDITLHKAVIVSEITLPYKVDEKTVYEVEFMALIDDTKEDGNLLASIGDTSVTK